MLTPAVKIRVNSSVLMLLVFGMAYLIFGQTGDGRILDMIKPFSFMLCYMLGLCVYQKKEFSLLSQEAVEKKVISIINLTSLGFFLHYVLNMSINLGAKTRDEILDFWTRTELAATLHAAMAFLPLAVAVATLLIPPKKWKKVVAAVVLVLIFSFNFILPFHKHLMRCPVPQDACIIVFSSYD